MNKKLGEHVDKLSNSTGIRKPKGGSIKKLPQELNQKDTKTISINQMPIDSENKKSDADLRTNITSEQTNIRIIAIDLEKSNMKKSRRYKLVQKLCESCKTTDKTKLIHCYLCKKIKCKPCAEKEHQYSSKKRDQSSYICEDCFNKDSFKLRSKPAAAEFSKLNIHNDINYSLDLNNINIKNSKNMKRKTIISKNEESEKKKEEILIEEKEDMLNLDFLYDCVSPPSELNRNSGIKGKTNLAPSLTKRKRRRVKNLNNPIFDLTCHQCRKTNPKVEYFKCVKAECGKFYCNKCIRRYSSLGNSKHINRIAKVLDYCYSCRRICKCEKCQIEFFSIKNSNFVQVDLENLDANKNIVKIDDYVILENAEVDDYSEEQQELFDLSKESEFIPDSKKGIDKEMKSSKNPGNYVLTIEEEKTKMCIDAVENSRNSHKSGKVQRCIRCDNHNPSNEANKENTLNFKSLEEFIVYLNYFFSQDLIKGDKEYAESHIEYNDYVSNYFKKYYSDSDYVFKSIKIICRDCFNTCLKAKNGFYNLFSYLHIGQNHANIKPKIEENALKNSAVIKINEKMEIVENSPEKLMQIKIPLCTSNNLIPENLSKNPINNSSILHGGETSVNNEVNSNNSRKENVPINSSLFSLYKNNQIPSAIFNPNQNPGQVNSNNSSANVNKILEMFCNIRQNPNAPNNQYNNSLLRNLIGNTMNNSNNNFNLGNINNVNSLLTNDFRQNVPNLQNSQNFEQNMGAINKNLNNTNNTTNMAQDSNFFNDSANDKENLMNLLSSLNPEALNVTNIINNIDNNTKSPGTCTGSVLTELKKQFFSIQYYSLLQKLFISYIFKNLELFIEQISKNQSLGEMIVNNLVSAIPKSTNIYQESNATEPQLLVQNINEQMALLKNINHYGINLTNALSSNFEDLKSNGIKIFKAMDPSLQQSIVSNLNSILHSIPENNQANMPGGINGFMSGSDLFNKSENNVNNQANGSIGNNSGINSGNNLQNDSLLQNFNILMNNLTNSNNNNNSNQWTNQCNNVSFNGFNSMPGLNKLSKPIPNSFNSFNNINNFNSLNCLNNLNSINNIVPGNVPSYNSSNKAPVNNPSIPQSNTSNSMNLTSQMISELLSQSNGSQNSSGNLNSLNLMNVLASLNKGMMNTNNFNQSTSSNNPPSNNPFASFMSPGLNNNLMMNMMGMNHLPTNQHSQMNQFNPMNQLGKSLIEKMSNYYTMSQCENTNKNHLNQNEQYNNNLQVVPNEKNLQDERQLEEEAEVNIDGKNNLANLASGDNDIEIENVEMNSNNV